jgi:hypothetical protein
MVELSEATGHRTFCSTPIEQASGNACTLAPLAQVFVRLHVGGLSCRFVSFCSMRPSDAAEACSNAIFVTFRVGS